MIWLEAALAFAITMLVFSTMVSVILETIHRVFGLRQAGLRVMLEKLFDEVLWPRVQMRVTARFEAKGMSLAVQEIRGKFLELMTTNRGQGQTWLPEIIKLRGKEASTLQTIEFMQRLAETEIGQAIASEAEAARSQLEAYIKDVAQKYDSFCQGASEYFQRRARLSSVVIAMVLAVVINIDAVRLFTRYLEDEQLRSSVIAQSENFQKLAEKQATEATAVLHQIKTQAGSTEEKTATQAQESIAAIKQNSEDFRRLLKGLESEGIPIGRDFYPYGERGKRAKTVNGSVAFIGWLLSALLAGLLIGLGAPFWFNAIKSLTVVTTVARGVLGPERSPSEERAREPADPTKAQPRTPVEAFEVALASARLHIETERQMAARRPLLLPNGETDTGEV